MEILKHSYIVILIATLTLTGCTAALVPYSSDPGVNIEQSMSLTSRGRPYAGRRALNGVIEKIDKNDSVLLARYYRSKAYLISDTQYQQRRKSNIDNYDWEVDGNFQEAESLYLQSISLFQKNQYYFEASNTSYLLSVYYEKDGNQITKCSALNDSKSLYMKGLELDPEKAKGVITTKDTKSFGEYLDKVILEKQCD